MRDIISELDNPCRDPHPEFKTGEVINVKVMQIDVARNRIGLSMRLDDEVERQPGK